MATGENGVVTQHAPLLVEPEIDIEQGHVTIQRQVKTVIIAPEAARKQHHALLANVRLLAYLIVFSPCSIISMFE